MKAAALVVPALVGALLAPAAGACGDTSASRTTPAASRAPRKLKLGPFADPYARMDDAALAELLRFYQHIEVEGKAPQDVQAAMETWWHHFNFDYAVYGRGYNIQKPMANGAINILPLIDWLKKKVKENRGNKMGE